MIEVIITTLSIIGWALSVWMHPRLSESCIQQEPTPAAIDEASAEFANQIVDAGEAVTVVTTGRDRKISNASEEDCGYYIEIDESLPVAICIIPTTLPTEETNPRFGGVGIRGFGILIQSHSSSELFEHQTS